MLGWVPEPEMAVSKPNMPYPTPLAYDGPKISASDIQYSFGYGKPSAGMLTSTGGGKSFGVYG